MPRGRRLGELMNLPWRVTNRASSMVTVTLLILAFLCKGLRSQFPGYDLKVLKAVTVQRGLCVHIPCNFTYPAESSTTSEDSNTGELYAYWIKNNRELSYISKSRHNQPGSIVASSDKGQSIASFARNRFQLTGNPAEGDCSLSINDIQNQDEGQYYFRFEKESLKISFHSKPQVSVTELTEKPKILNSSEVVLGKSVTLICQAPGTCPWKESWSQPQISWSTGSSTTQNHQHSNGSWTFASGFTFTPFLQDQGRVLTCRVYYPATWTTVENTISLEVVYPPKDIGITRPGHPDFSAQKERLVVREGDAIRLLCEAQGKPSPSMTWLKNNKALNNHTQSSKETLHLPNIKPEDAGLYHCQAENPYGSIRKNLSVNVQYAPRLSIKPQKNTNCWRKDNDILCNCSLNSKPPPQIHWQVDGITVTEDSSTANLKVSSSVQENEVTSSLIWTGSLDGDLSIICLGYNPLGTYTKEFLLISLEKAASELIVPLLLGLILMKILFCFVFFFLAFRYSSRRKAPLAQEGRRKQRE